MSWECTRSRSSSMIEDVDDHIIDMQCTICNEYADEIAEDTYYISIHCDESE